MGELSGKVAIITGAGQKPESRRLAKARSLSGRRGGRLLPPWPERATSRWPSVNRQLARLLEARGVSGLHGHGKGERGRSRQRCRGRLVARRWWDRRGR